MRRCIAFLIPTRLSYSVSLFDERARGGVFVDDDVDCTTSRFPQVQL